MGLKERLYLYRTRATRVCLLVGLYLRNVFSHESLTSDGGPIVSLTSHGRRLRTVFATIESIGHGSVKPSEIILWVDDRSSLDNSPRTLKRLRRRGLQLKLSENFGPHTKYYPYVASQESFTGALVTADDDQFYSKDWLEALVAAAERRPDAIHCHRAHIITCTDDGKIEPYGKWLPGNNTESSPRVFATGVSGVIYPARFLEVLKAAGEQFRDSAPRADDIWLHACALRSGFSVHQIGSLPKHHLEVPFSQGIALRRSNVDDGANDHQIAATYSASDLEMLRVIDHDESVL